MQEYLRFFNIIGGVGILLFSLRYLNTIIESTVTRRLKPLVNRILSNEFNSFLSSFFGTIVIQASSITVIGAMGLLSNSIITIEQAFFVAMGASLGSAVKGWLFNVNIFDYALISIGFSSILLVFFKRLIIREVLELFLALGFAFLSINIMSQILPDITNSDYFKNFISFYDADSLQNQLTGVLIGLLVTFLVQSSSSFILVVLTLASLGTISFSAGTSLILGANIGSTLTPLIMSLEYERSVKKLALAYTFSKIIGVFITLFFFPYFINSVDKIFILIYPTASVGEKVLGSHTFFNIINCIWWTFFYSFLLKTINLIIPDKEYTKTSLSSVIRKIVSSNYKIAMSEIENQITLLEKVTKNLTDYCLELMMSTNISENHSSSFHIFRKDFEDLKDTVYEIILQLNKINQGVKKDYNKTNLKFISKCNDFYSQALAFSMHLEQGIFIDYYTFPDEIKQHFEAFESYFNEIWLSVLLNKSTKESFDSINNIIDEIENEYFELISKNNKYTYQHLTWIYESIGYMKKLVYSLTTVKKSINLFKVKDFEKK
ncbi:MAG: Na/Pi symporter [Candidatus Sericytochromatia bacterium]